MGRDGKGEEDMIKDGVQRGSGQSARTRRLAGVHGLRAAAAAQSY